MRSHPLQSHPPPQAPAPPLRHPSLHHQQLPWTGSMTSVTSTSWTSTDWPHCCAPRLRSWRLLTGPSTGHTRGEGGGGWQQRMPSDGPALQSHTWVSRAHPFSSFAPPPRGAPASVPAYLYSCWAGREAADVIFGVPSPEKNVSWGGHSWTAGRSLSPEPWPPSAEQPPRPLYRHPALLNWSFPRAFKGYGCNT